MKIKMTIKYKMKMMIKLKMKMNYKKSFDFFSVGGKAVS